MFQTNVFEGNNVFNFVSGKDNYKLFRKFKITIQNIILVIR